MSDEKSREQPWAGMTCRILRVDLSSGTISREERDERYYRKWLGGSGLIAQILLTEVPAGADALGPENKLVFALSPVTGTPVYAAGRNGVGAKSPLSGGIALCQSGEYWGAELKKAGYDVLIVEGKADKPVYISIKDGEVAIRDAAALWGLLTKDTQAAIREELGDKRVRVAMIGPGGENLIPFACIMNGPFDAAGRGGLGAVMGSKNLKAVAARGKPGVPVADEDKVRELSRWMRDHWKDKSWRLHDLGTNEGLANHNVVGALPTRNFQDGQFEGASKIDGEALRDTITIDRGGCYACPINCKRVVQVDDGDYTVNPLYGGPEYETVGAFGSNCGVDDLRAIAKANEICNAYGLDTISTGMMVSFAMECYEAGLLTEKETGGLELNFGNGKAMVELTRLIGERQGLGDVLAEGPKAAAAWIGPGAEQFAIAVKNQPFPMHECRTRHGQALGYAVSPTGADHNHNFWDEGLAHSELGEGLQSLGVYTPVARTELNADKVRAYIPMTNWSWLHNHLGHCLFIPWTRDQLVELVRGITGWETNVYELLLVGERGVTMARAFNLREGLTRADDVLPPRMRMPHKSRTLNEKPIDPEVLDENLSTFYGMMGWDPQTGVPTLAKLQELDIEWVAEALSQQ